MAVTSNGEYFLYSNVKDTFPQSSTLTGTVTITNGELLVTGSGTSFGSEIQRGDWLYDVTNGLLYQVSRVISDTELTIDKRATATSTSVKKTPKQFYSSIAWAIDNAGTAKINGLTFPAEQSATREIDVISRKRPDPILIDSTTNGNVVYVQAQI